MQNKLGYRAQYYCNKKRPLRQIMLVFALQAHQVDGRWFIDVDDDAAPKQTIKRMNSERDRDPVEEPLVAQLQSENQHLRDQVDKLTQVLAM